MNTVMSIKRGLLLLGSFILAYILAQFFHEICHSTAAYLSGGNFGKITIHPFSWSYSYSSSPNRILHTAAGPLGASLIGLLIFILSYRWTKPQLLPILLIAPVIFLDNGGYLLIDTLMRSGGDACSLINYGIHTIVIITIAVILLVAGFISVILLIKKTGLLAGQFKDRLITLTVGIVTYILVSLIWHFFCNRSETMLWLAYAVYESVIVLVMAAIPVKSLSKGVKTIRWKTVFIIDLLGIFLVVFLLVYPQAKKPSSVKMYSERPDDFPKVLALPPYATAPFFTNFLYRKGYRYLLSYSFPESTPTNEIYSFLMETHNQNGYTLLKHSISDPNEIYNNNWVEKIKEIDAKSYYIKECRQNWLKIYPQLSLSSVDANYKWREGKFVDASVLQVVTGDLPLESVLIYTSLHPKDFDPNQLEQLKNIQFESKKKN